LVDILEMAKLKGKLRSLETERGQLKFVMYLLIAFCNNLKKIIMKIIFGLKFGDCNVLF